MTANVLHANEQVAVIMLVMFTVGIGLGSLLCSLIMGGEISARFVPFAGLAMSLISLDLYFLLDQIPQSPTDATLIGAPEFVGNFLHVRILVTASITSSATFS